MAVAKTKVLIIEAGSALRNELKGILVSRGHSVSSFASAQRGLDEMERKHFDLVIARANGDGPSGIEVLSKGKKLHPEILFIMIAGEVNSLGAVQSLKAGASDLLLEPFTPLEVAETVDRTLAPRKEQITARKIYQYIKKEEREFCIPSDETAIGPVVDLLVENLSRAGICSHIESKLVAIALTEAISNSIYHGNLNISPHMKLHMSAEEFKKEVRKRLLAKAYKERKVRIQYNLSPNEVEYVITDDGDGFNTRGWLLKEEESGSKKESGRGLYLLRRLMDSVTYNEKGNQVTLVKKTGKKGAK